MATPPQNPRTGWLAFLGEALRSGDRDFTRGSLKQAVALLAVPMVLEFSMESVFTLVDVFFVARLGSDAVAAVGLTEAFMTLVYAVSFGLALPVTAVVARRIGEKDPDGAAKASAQASFVGIAVAVFVAVPGAWLAPDLLRAMGASNSVVAVGSGYASVLLASNIVIVLLFLNGAVFRGAGDATVAMRALALANGINIVLDPCLIFGLGPFPELGLVGAAVATTIGRSVGVAYQYFVLFRGTARLRVRARHLRFDGALVLQILKLSVGGIGQNLVETASWVVLVRIVSLFGSAAVAGYTIAVRILIFALLPAWGFGNAAATLVGQSLGAKQPDRAERAVLLSGTYNMVFLAVFGVVFIPFSSFWVSLFTNDPEARIVGAECLWILSCGNLLYAWGVVLVQAFNGAGDTTTPFWIHIVCFWFVKLPAAFILARVLDFGTTGVWIAVTSAYCLSAVVAYVIFRRGSWKTRVV